MAYISKADREAKRVSDIVARKKVVSNNILLLRNYLLHEVAEAVAAGETVPEMTNRLNRAWKLNRWGRYKDERILQECKNLGRKLIIKKQMNPNFDADKTVRGIINSSTVGTTNKQRLEYSNAFEAARKGKMVKDMLDNNPNDLFLACSAHSQPAPDHKNWQGKMYIRKDWRSRLPDDDRAAEKAIASYVQRNSVKPFEWVIGEPVYMVFRPNCKHFFMPVSTIDVLKMSVPNILKKEHLLRDEDDNVPQSNARRNYRRHLNKLKLLEQMPKTPQTKYNIQREKQYIEFYKQKIIQEQNALTGRKKAK